MCRSNRGTVSGYFLAGRYMLWLPVCIYMYMIMYKRKHIQVYIDAMYSRESPFPCHR